MDLLPQCLKRGVLVLSIFFSVAQPSWAHDCDGTYLMPKESQIVREMRASIGRYLEAQGFGLKTNAETVVVDGWELTPVQVTRSNRPGIEHFLKQYVGADYNLKNRYFVVRKGAELISIALESDYKDWGVTSYSNILVTERWASKFQSSAEIGLEIPFNKSLLPLFQRYSNGIVTLHHYAGLQIAQYPVPTDEGDFQDRPYIQFGGSYSGPNLESNPYSARLLSEVSKFLHYNPSRNSILVVGSGIGYEAIHLLRTCPHCQVDVSEIDANSLENTKWNIRAHKLGGRTEAYLSDLFKTISGRYDLIVFAPPRVATQESLERTKPERVELLRRTLTEYRTHLNAGGIMMIMSDDVELPKLAASENRVQLLFQGGHWGGEGKAAEGRFGIFRVQPITGQRP